MRHTQKVVSNNLKKTRGKEIKADMNPITKFSIKLSFLLIAFVIVGCNETGNQSDKIESDDLIVLVKYKVQPDKVGVAVAELDQLIELVKEEPHFIKIMLHVDPKDNTNILLYEEWGSESHYNSEHMNTVHLKKFISNSRNFLAGPPEISQWRIQRI